MIWFSPTQANVKWQEKQRFPSFSAHPPEYDHKRIEREITSVLHSRMDQGGVPACSSTSCDFRLLTLLLWEAVCSIKTPPQCKKVIWLLLFQMIIKKGYFLFRKHLWIDLRRQHMCSGVLYEAPLGGWPPYTGCFRLSSSLRLLPYQ